MSGRTASFELWLPQPPPRLFAYLAEPRNRPEWQTSLRSVDLIDEGDPHEGMSWVETTSFGIRPHMEIAELTPYRVFTEVGEWRGIEGRLTLRFLGQRGGSRINSEVELSGSGMWRAVANTAGWMAERTIRRDLETASQNLSRASRSH